MYGLRIKDPSHGAWMNIKNVERCEMVPSALPRGGGRNEAIHARNELPTIALVGFSRGTVEDSKERMVTMYIE